MPTKYLALVACLFTSFCYQSCSLFKGGKKVEAMTGTYQTEPITIDGDSKDWPSPYPNYDSKAKVAYATSNDENNIYITMETGDELTQMKILKNGMTVSIDTGGNKGTNLNINFPMQNANDPFEMPSLENKQKKNEPSDRLARKLGQNIKKAANDANQYALEGFPDCNGAFVINQASKCGIKVKLGVDEFNELVWEAIVPYKALQSKDGTPALKPGKIIGVCFDIKGYKKPSTKNDAAAAPQTSSPMSGNSMRGTSGAGMRGQGGGAARSQPENPLQHLYENTKTWKHFNIVAKP